MSHIARLEPDQILEIFSYFTLPQLCNSAVVCKQWFYLHSNERLWKPILNEFKPLLDRVSQKEEEGRPISSKLWVRGLFKSHIIMANSVTRMIRSEDSLKLILNDPPLSLEELKGMPSVLRLLEISKGLSTDSTGLLVSLVDHIQIVALNNYCSLSRFFVDSTGETHDSEAINITQSIYTVILLDFIRTPISRFNGAEMIKCLQSAATNPIPAFSEIVNQARISIFDSHQKFPNLLAESGC